MSEPSAAKVAADEFELQVNIMARDIDMMEAEAEGRGDAEGAARARRMERRLVEVVDETWREVVRMTEEER